MISRYLPQSRLPEIGKEGQERLAKARVLIVGCGALGAPVAMYLAGAGVGKLVIADFDNVELSNLHRQVFYSETELGLNKAERLKRRIEALNSDVSVETWTALVSRKILETKGTEFDAIADCADNPSSTYMLDEFCRGNGIPLSIAGVSDWRAQVFTALPGSLSYGDIIPKPAYEGGILPCSVTGILGPVAAFAASLQAAEIIKILTRNAGNGSKLITANLLTGQFSVTG